MIFHTWRKKAEYPAMKEDRESNTTCFFRFYKMNTSNFYVVQTRCKYTLPPPLWKECTCSMDIW